ncbi:MAG: hypothetical protein JXQ27_05525 [Acidobacteria bacterium]|nr:hypothetical protein [Acidobacteriota bacterium]
MTRIGGFGGTVPPQPDPSELDKADGKTAGRVQKAGADAAAKIQSRPDIEPHHRPPQKLPGSPRQSEALTDGSLQKMRLMTQTDAASMRDLLGSVRAHVDNYGTIKQEVELGLTRLAPHLADASTVEPFRGELSASQKTMDGIGRLVKQEQPATFEMSTFSQSLSRHMGNLREMHDRLALSTAGESSPQRLDRDGLSETIREVEGMQETVRNRRQMASTSFQNFDQKANQLYNLLSNVMKAMNEMRMGTVRNML